MNYVNTYFLDIITKHFFDFSGKATRQVYWLFWLNCVIVYFVLSAIWGILATIFTLTIFLPSLGILARRLRDAGFSPWLELLLLIPVVGWIIVIILVCLPSK